MLPAPFSMKSPRWIPDRFWRPPWCWSERRAWRPIFPRGRWRGSIQLGLCTGRPDWLQPVARLMLLIRKDAWLMGRLTTAPSMSTSVPCDGDTFLAATPAGAAIARYSSLTTQRRQLMPQLPANWLTLIAGPAILIAVAWVADWLTIRVLRGAIRRVAKRTTSTWDDRVIERNVFARLAHAVPAVIIYYGILPALGVSAADVTASADAVAFAAGITQRVALAYIVLTATMAASSFLDAVNDIYNESYSESRSRPIKGYLQVVGLVLYIAAGVVIVSILADRSPVVFLSGLGALTAVLMLVFRDTILSLVASLQIMSNDMIRIRRLGGDAASER